MYRKPELAVTLYFFKCLLRGCKKPYGIMQTARSDADRNWYHHWNMRHSDEELKVNGPTHIIKEKKFKALPE